VALTAPGHRVAHVDELERIDATGHGWWRPMRRHLEHPGHGEIHYQLACFRALDGDREGALADLIAAVAADPRTAEWASDDADPDSIRDDPRFPAA
jgi:thioredoxin-like negative regulator of GroEL